MIKSLSFVFGAAAMLCVGTNAVQAQDRTPGDVSVKALETPADVRTKQLYAENPSVGTTAGVGAQTGQSAETGSAAGQGAGMTSHSSSTNSAPNSTGPQGAAPSGAASGAGK